MMQKRLDSKTNRDIMSQAQSFVEKKLGFSQTEINKQQLQDLEKNLAKVNEYLDKPESYKVLSVIFRGPFGGIPEVTDTSVSDYQVNISSILLELKKKIVQRISLLKGDQQVKTLKDLIQNFNNGINADEVLSKLKQELNQLEESVCERQESQELDQEIYEKKQKVQEDLERQWTELDLFDKKTNIWLRVLNKIFDREFVATIVGALLLIVITCAQIHATFNDIKTSDILNNSFLVILGYFFGQSINRGRSDEKDG